MQDYSFEAQAFGPILAEVAREDYAGNLTPALILRAKRGWGLAPLAERAVIRAALRILQAPAEE